VEWEQPESKAKGTKENSLSGRKKWMSEIQDGGGDGNRKKMLTLDLLKGAEEGNKMTDLGDRKG